MAESAIALATINLFMQLGLAVSVSAAQTILRNRLPVFLQMYAPNVDANLVAEAGATSVQELVSAEDMTGFLRAYNMAITEMFVSNFFPGVPLKNVLFFGWFVLTRRPT